MPTDNAIVVIKGLIVLGFVTLFLMAIQHQVIQ